MTLIVTAYLYGQLENVIYMKALPELIDRVNFHVNSKHDSNLNNGESTIDFDHLNKLVLHNTSKAIALQASIVQHSKSTRVMPWYIVQILCSLYGFKQSGHT